MGIKYSKNVEKIGFADIGINQPVTQSQPFYGYFPADKDMTIEQRKELLYRYGAEENCYKQPQFCDDKVGYNSVPNEDCGCNSLPDASNLTDPPNQMELLDNPLVQLGVLALGTYIFIKLVS